MKMYLRCGHSKAANLPRTKRAPGCEHKWAYTFKHRGVPVPLQSPHTNRDRAKDWLLEEFRRHREGLPSQTGAPASSDSTTTSTTEPTSTQTLGDLRTAYLRWAKGAKPEGTYIRYERMLKRAVDFVGVDLPVSPVSPSPAIINLWRDHRRGHGWTRTGRLRKQHTHRSTLNCELAIWQAMLSDGRALGFNTPRLFGKTITFNGQVMKGLAKEKLQKGEKRPVQTFTDDECALVVDQMPEPYSLICRITMEALPRISEAIALERHHVTLQRIGPGKQIGMMTRFVKGGDTLTVPIPLDLAKALLAHAPGSTRIFPELADVPRYTVSHRIIAELRALGLPGSHHGFRHTGITNMLIDKTDVETIRQLAGWTTLAMLANYTHVQGMHKLAAIERNAARLKAAQARRRAAARKAAA